MPIGGAEEKDGNPEILETFVELAGGKDARIALIPTASDEPEDAVKRYTKAFEGIGVACVTPILGATHAQVESEESLQILRDATGIFISGGDQARLAEIYCGTKAAECILERNQNDVVIAGTSAGAAFMASHMIAGGESGATPIKGMADISEGLGLLQNIIIDTHYGPRGRTGRLLMLHALHSEVIALGFDEDTAAVIDHDLVMNIIGSGAVTIVDGSSIRSDINERKDDEPLMVNGVELHVVTNRYCFDLRGRKFVPPLSV
jgi:cyanophycinase